MTDFSHLHALEARLDRECGRLAGETRASAIALREVWIAQIEKEIAGERQFLGLNDGLSDDELLAALGVA